jgi:DNA-binding PadR family transcriptional regulator
MLNEEELGLLRVIQQLKHPTTDDLHRHGLAQQPRYALYRTLKKLEQAGLIARALLAPEQGARSPRYYHLRLAGARALGLEAVGSDHYRQPSPKVYQASHVRRELALVAARQQWRVVAEDRAARQVLTAVLSDVARATYGETFPAHTLLPATFKLHPDLLVDTGQRVIIVIVGHPHGTAQFWRARVARYQPVLFAVTAVCFALSEQQRQEAEEAVQASLQAKRFLVLRADQLDDLVRRLAPSR